jgi:putative flavoprotein involved in K+ transport
MSRPVDVLVIGAGQAGLGAAYWLRRASRLEVQVIDRAEVGSSWLARWDTLRLFTPRRFSGLPGMRFPEGQGFPSREEVAAYLRCYTRQFELPVQTGHEVRRLSWSGGVFRALTSVGDIRAYQVVLATGPFTRPYRPAASQDLDEGIFQLHSAAYRRPTDVPDGPVVVVGGGNSAAQLALELSRTRQVVIVSPRPLWFLPERVLGADLYWWLFVSGTLNARAWAPVSHYVRRRGDAIIGTDLRRHIRAGKIRVITGRVTAADAKHLILADGLHVPVGNVLWCTGFRPDLDWIDIDGVVGPSGEPLHHHGASRVPGLHWMGLPWQTRLNSSIIDGVDRDARAVTKRARSASGTERGDL